MKKKLAIVCLLFIACHTAGLGQKNVNQLFSKYSKLKDINKVDVGNAGMMLAGLFTDTFGAESVEVFDLSACTAKDKERFSQAIGSLRDDAYETVVQASENGERVKVLLRLEGEVIRELVVLSSGQSPAMVRIKGHISRQDIDKLIREHSR
jgi:hypothetical protein